MPYSTTQHTCDGRPWVTIRLSRPDGVGSDLPVILVCPGGGFGLRDFAPFEDASHPGAKPPFKGGLYESGGTYEDTYAVAVVTVASQSHQALPVRLDDSQDWAPDTAYAPDDVAYFNGRYYRSRLNQISYNGTVTTPAAWNSGTAYSIGDRVTSGGTSYVATAANTNEEPSANPGSWDRFVFGGEPGEVDSPPNSGLSGLISWREALVNDATLTRIPGRGEMTNAYGAQAAADLRHAVMWLRRNAARLGLTQTVVAYGDSAGGYNWLQAIGMGPGGVPAGYDARSMHSSRAGVSPMPDAAIIDIAPSKWDQFATTSVQGQTLVLSFNRSLYGDPRMGTFSAWSQVPTEERRQIDPWWIAKDSGFSIPVYFTTPNSRWDEVSESVVYNGRHIDPASVPDWLTATAYTIGDLRENGNQVYECIADHVSSAATEPGNSADWRDVWTDYNRGPDVHHALHGKQYLELWRENHGRTDCVHFEQGVQPDEYRRHIRYPNSGNGQSEIDFTVITATDEQLPVTMAEDILLWLAGVLSA